jgi:hypothetical protein
MSILIINFFSALRHFGLKLKIMRNGEIRDITTQEANNLVYSEVETGKYTPLGLFIYKRRNNDFDAYDNSTGCCWGNNFFSREAAVEWLLCNIELMEEKRKLSHIVWNLALEAAGNNQP